MDAKSLTQGTHALISTPPPPDFFLLACAESFLLDRKVQNLSPATILFYQKQIKLFTRFCDGLLITDLRDISPTVIRQFLLWLEETGHNPGGIHAAYRSLKAFLRWVESEFEPEGWKNPIHKVKAPKVAIEPLEPAALDTIQALLDTCDLSFIGRRDRALLLALLDTGARARELLSFTLADCNPLTGAALIRQGKGKKPRTVFLGRKARHALRQYLKLRRADHPALWLTDDGGPLHYDGLRAIVQRRAGQAGVPAPSLHAFRRAFALNMLRAGVDVITLARLMGHASLAVLQRYLKQLPTDLQAAHALGSPVDNMGGKHG